MHVNQPTNREAAASMYPAAVSSWLSGSNMNGDSVVGTKFANIFNSNAVFASKTDSRSEEPFDFGVSPVGQLSMPGSMTDTQSTTSSLFMPDNHALFGQGLGSSCISGEQYAFNNIGQHNTSHLTSQAQPTSSTEALNWTPQTPDISQTRAQPWDSQQQSFLPSTNHNFDDIPQETANQLFRKHLERTDPNSVCLATESGAQKQWSDASDSDNVVQSSSNGGSMSAPSTDKPVTTASSSKLTGSQQTNDLDLSTTTDIYNILLQPLEMELHPELIQLKFNFSSCWHVSQLFRVASQVEILESLMDKLKHVRGFPWFHERLFNSLINVLKTLYQRIQEGPRTVVAESQVDYCLVGEDVLDFGRTIVYTFRSGILASEFEDLKLYLLIVLKEFARDFQAHFLPEYDNYPSNSVGHDTMFMFKMLSAMMGESWERSDEIEAMRQQITRRNCSSRW